jgi:hypothetical protein
MKEVSREDIIRIQGAYRKKYGMQMDDWSASVLYEIHEHFEQLDNRMHISAQQVRRAGETIKGSHKAIHFKSNWQAFFFGLGVTAPVSLVGIVISILIFWFASNSRDYQNKKLIIDTYENVSNYVLLMQNGKTINKSGAYYLVLEHIPKKGDVIIGKHYIFDQKKKQVLVPLGTKKTVEASK